MIFNMIGSNGPSMKSTIIVSVSTGSTVGAYTDAACTNLVKSATERNTGEFWITGLDNGLYYIKATKNADESIVSYTINEFGVYRINMIYSQVPEFTYTGDYEIVQDDDTFIDLNSYEGTDWKIRFLTSGTLNFSQLKGAENGIDVFLVGGGGGGGNKTSDKGIAVGGGGGAGGYTTTASNISVTEGTDYSIVIGAGGATKTDGGLSSAFNQTANAGIGGATGTSVVTGAGGSGGGGGSGLSTTGGSGGSDGASGNGTARGGAGQGTTTREFGGYLNTVNANVSAASAFVLGSEPTEIEKAFLVSGKYITIERSGVTRRGITNVFPIVSYNNSTRTVTLNTTYQTITASAGDIVRFGNLYAGGGGGGAGSNGNSPYNGGIGGFGGGGAGSGKTSGAGLAGTANTGGGGGAGGYDGLSPHVGGSGIVIIRNAR